MSLPSITFNQVLAILLRRDSERQLKTLSPSDIVVSPQLGDFSSYDFQDTLQIVNAGERAADAVARPIGGNLARAGRRVCALGGSKRWRDRDCRQLQFSERSRTRRRYKRQIAAMAVGPSGHWLDPEALKEQTDMLYGRGDLELLDYHLVKDGSGQTGLDFNAQRTSWGPNYLRFRVSLEDGIYTGQRYYLQRRRAPGFHRT